MVLFMIGGQSMVHYQANLCNFRNF